MSSQTVSVIIPTYNRAHLLTATLKSVLAQTWPIHEIIVVDDGSTDDTAGTVRAFLREHAPAQGIVHYFYQENQGRSGAINTGVVHATGAWISLQDSDDLWLPRKLELQFKTLEKFGPAYGVCFTDAEFTNHPAMKKTALEKAGKLPLRTSGSLQDPVFFLLEDPHGVYTQTVLMRSDVVKRVGAFDQHLIISEDTDYLFRLALITGFCYVSEPLVQIDRTLGRQGSSTEIVHKDSVRIRLRQHMFEKWLALASGQSVAVRNRIRKHWRDVVSQEANMHLMTGDLEKALMAMEKAHGLQPTVLGKLKLATMRLAPELMAAGVRMRARFTKPELI